MYKTSHCGSKQQQRSCTAISHTIACSRYICKGVIRHTHPFRDESHNQLNATGEVAKVYFTSGLGTHPCESYLVFDGKLVKNDDAAYADADVITLTNNAMMQLFSNIKCQLLGQEIESLFHPGQATTMLGLLKFPDGFQKSTDLIQLWYKDNGTTAHLQNNQGFGFRQQYIVQKPDPKGTFSLRVSLKHIVGFCDDYEKIVYGFKHQLSLIRKGDNDVIFRNNVADAGKVVLTKLSWYC